jgi:4-amino-4-deoxy-L-arabinose transferase-like glycosyltransferase
LAFTLFGLNTARLTLILISLNPYLARWAGTALSESLHLTLTVGTICVFIRAPQTSKKLWYGLSGVLWALATLCRPITVLLLPMMVATIYFYAPKVEQRVQKAAIVLLFGALMMSPWTVRNWLQFNRFIPLQTVGYGEHFWLTTVDTEDQPVNGDWEEKLPTLFVKYPEYAQYHEFLACKNEKVSIDEERAWEATLIRYALQRVMKDPWGYFLSRAQRYPRLWLHSGEMWFSNVSFQSAVASRQYLILSFKTSLGFLFSVLPLSFAIAGIYLSRRNWRTLCPILLVPLLIGVNHLPLWVETRYSLAAMPFLLLFAAFGLSQVEVATIRLWYCKYRNSYSN